MLGSLSALSALESEATNQQKKEAEARSRQINHQLQLQKIQQLKQRRDELLQLLHDKATSESSQRNNPRSTTETEDEEAQVTSALAYISELKEKLQVYRITGVSVVKTDPDSKVLCFTTSYRGVYMESYHLKLQRLASGNFKVVHHDLPPFIVFSALPSDLEVKDVVSALRPVQEALAMFIYRREELKGAQGKFPDHLNVVESSAALDYLCCHLDVSADDQVEIILKYADLNHYLPSSVKVVLLKRDGKRVKEDIPQDLVHTLHTDFTSHRLCVALAQTANLIHSYLSAHQ